MPAAKFRKPTCYIQLPCRRRPAPKLMSMGGPDDGVRSFRLAAYTSVFPSSSPWPILTSPKCCFQRLSITANIRVNRLAMNTGRYKGRRSEELAGLHPRDFLLRPQHRLAQPVSPSFISNEKPYTSNRNLCYTVNVDNSQHHKQSVPRRHIKVQSQYAPRFPGGTAPVYPTFKHFIGTSY
jgi:hypothetical protein